MTNLNTSENTNQPPQRRWSRITARDRAWLAGLAVFALAAFIGWKPLRHELVMSLALRSDAPSDSVLSELADEAPNRARTLERMWRSGNLTVRLFVMDYLKARLHIEPALVSQMETIVKEAAHDPDLNVREPAINILAEAKHADSTILLRQQLSDTDPAVRVLGLQQLQRVASSNDVPAAIHLLDDPDARVAVQAALLLRKATGLDFGIKTTHALPRFSRSEGEPFATPNLEAIRLGVQQWHEWWIQHREEFPETVMQPRIAVSELRAKDFALENLDGRTVRLSDYRGKIVLLCFWKIGDAASFDDLAALKQLQQQQPERLVVLTVAFAPTVGPQDDHGGHEHQHGHAHSPSVGVDPAASKSAVRDLVARMGVNYPVLVDATGTAVFRYNVQEVPAYALIDAQGNLHRRFTGPRELAVWTAMVQELSTR